MKRTRTRTRTMIIICAYSIIISFHTKMAKKTMRKSRNTIRQSRARRGSRRQMRKNKTMKRGGGFGSVFGNMAGNLAKAGLNRAVKTGINHAASAANNGRISFSNPQGVKMPTNLLGVAKSSFDKHTNNSPGMSPVDRFKSFGEGVSKFSNSGLGKSLLNSKVVNNLGDSMNRSIKERMTNFSVGTGK